MSNQKTTAKQPKRTTSFDFGGGERIILTFESMFTGCGRRSAQFKV
jgi:hypothetical protein